jgi:hypothetical protein
VNGCLKFVVRLVAVAVLVLAGAVAWLYRDPILHAASRWLGPRPPLPQVTDTVVGAPSPKALHSTQGKIDRFKGPAAPDSVVLSANEVASMIGSGIDWQVRKSFDSLRVELSEGSVAVHCRLDTRVIPPDAIGPLAALLQPMEPLRIAGPVRIARPGVALWTIKELSLRGMAFPSLMTTQLAQRVAGADADGAVALRVSPSFQDIAIHPTGVVLYKSRRPAR